MGHRLDIVAIAFEATIGRPSITCKETFKLNWGESVARTGSEVAPAHSASEIAALRALVRSYDWTDRPPARQGGLLA